MSSPEAELYAALARAFGAFRLRWYVFGAQAAIMHGAARLTEDVDVTVDGTRASAQEIVVALEREGFQLRVTQDIERFVERTRVLPMLHTATTIPVDVVLSGPGIEELFFEHTVLVDIEGTRIPVAAAEDVVVMKTLAGRAKDVEDVVALLAAREPHFDLARVRHLLGLLEQALEQSDLRPAFEAALARADRARRK